MEDKKQTAKMNVPMGLWQEDAGGTPPQAGDKVCIYGTIQGMTNANLLVDVDKVEPSMDEGSDEDMNETNNSEQAPPETTDGSMG